MTRQKLTDKAVAALEQPEKGQKIVWDAECRGFGVRLTRGTKTFIVQGLVNGRDRRVKVASTDTFSASEARKRAKAYLQDMANGIDPNEVKRGQKVQTIKLEEVSEAYIQDRDLKPSSVKDIRKHINNAFADWKASPVVKISRDEVLARFRKLSKKGPAQANQAFRVLRALLNYAQATYRPGGKPLIIENPVQVLSDAKLWHDIQPKTRRIPTDKVGHAWNLLQGFRADPAVGVAAHSITDAVAFCLLTGCRWGEAQKLIWDRVNLEEGTWFLPDPKNKQPVTLPLSSQAQAIIEGRPRIEGNQYVFCSNKSKTGHIGPGRYITDELSKRLSIEVSPHDMRRTFRAIAGESGVEFWQVKLLMNHKVNGDITLQSYTEKTDLKYLKPQVQKIGNWIERQARIAASEKVVDLDIARQQAG